MQKAKSRPFSEHFINIWMSQKTQRKKSGPTAKIRTFSVPFWHIGPDPDQVRSSGPLWSHWSIGKCLVSLVFHVFSKELLTSHWNTLNMIFFGIISHSLSYIKICIKIDPFHCLRHHSTTFFLFFGELLLRYPDYDVFINISPPPPSLNVVSKNIRFGRGLLPLVRLHAGIVQSALPTIDWLF